MTHATDSVGRIIPSTMWVSSMAMILRNDSYPIAKLPNEERWGPCPSKSYVANLVFVMSTESTRMMMRGTAHANHFRANPRFLSSRVVVAML
jgi:hypothetical protein